jgi:hypothetical protein
MDFGLTAEQQQSKESARSFLVKECESDEKFCEDCGANRGPALWDSTRRTPRRSRNLNYRAGLD